MISARLWRRPLWRNRATDTPVGRRNELVAELRQRSVVSARKQPGRRYGPAPEPHLRRRPIDRRTKGQRRIERKHGIAIVETPAAPPVVEQPKRHAVRDAFGRFVKRGLTGQ